MIIQCQFRMNISRDKQDFWSKVWQQKLCDLRISRGRFFAPYFGGQKLDLYAEKYGTTHYITVQYSTTYYSAVLGLHTTSKSHANASKIFCWQVTDANYLPAGKYIKISDIFQNLWTFTICL